MRCKIGRTIIHEVRTFDPSAPDRRVWVCEYCEHALAHRAARCLNCGAIGASVEVDLTYRIVTRLFHGDHREPPTENTGTR